MIRNHELMHLTADRLLVRECVGYSPDAPYIYFLPFLSLLCAPGRGLLWFHHRASFVLSFHVGIQQ